MTHIIKASHFAIALDTDAFITIIHHHIQVCNVNVFILKIPVKPDHPFLSYPCPFSYCRTCDQIEITQEKQSGQQTSNGKGNPCQSLFYKGFYHQYQYITSPIH
jgi:hypothetical protein